MIPNSNEQLLTDINAREYFQGVVESALSNQQVNACHETIIYIVNLLTVFVRSESLFEKTADGTMIKPLALMYGEALEARSICDRDQALQKLGDVSLFISGLFANSLSRSLVDVDYYIAMGGNAYSFLADSNRVARSSQVLKDVFMELAGSFASFVDILAEVGDQTNLNNRDIMRLYEIWLSSGSAYAEEKLRNLGIRPVMVNRYQH